MALVLGALLVGGVLGWFAAGNAGDNEDDNIGNRVDVVNNITARMTVRNDTKCAASISDTQLIDAKCIPYLEPNEYCPEGGDTCRSLYNQYLAQQNALVLGIKNSTACVNSINICGCAGAVNQVQCSGNCSTASQNACFACVGKDIKQSNFRTALVSQCEQQVISAAKMQASIETTSKQTNLIVADALTAVLGNEVKGNATDLTTNILNEFEFTNALECTARVFTNQTIRLEAGGFYEGMEQNSSVVVGSTCMQDTKQYAESVTKTVTTVDQALDQTFKSPFSFLTDIYGILIVAAAAVMGVVLVIIVVFIGMSVNKAKYMASSAASMGKDKFCGNDISKEDCLKLNKKRRDGLIIGGSVVGVIIVILIIVIAVLTTNAPASKIDETSMITTKELPNTRTILTTVGADGRVYWVYAAGPFLIAMEKEVMQNLIGADETSVNKIEGQALGRFLLHGADGKDVPLTSNATETYTGTMFQPVTRKISTIRTSLRCYVSSANTVVTDISKAIPSAQGQATYVPLTAQDADVATLTFDPVGANFPNATFISKKDASGKKVFLSMKVVKVNENFTDEVLRILEEQKAKIPQGAGPTEEEIETFKKSQDNVISYGFLDWSDNPAAKTQWNVENILESPQQGLAAARQAIESRQISESRQAIESRQISESY